MPMKYCSYSERSRSRRFSSSSSATSISLLGGAIASVWQGSHAQVVEAHAHLPIVEPKVFVAEAPQRLWVGVSQNLHAIDSPANGPAVTPLNLELVGALWNHSTSREIGFSRRQLNLSAISSVFVDAREHMEMVVPASEDRQVTRGVGVGHTRCRTATISPELGFDV